MNRPYKAYKKTEEETRLNKEIGKKIKEARLNHVVMYEVEQDMNGESFIVKQARKKLVTQSELSKHIGGQVAYSFLQLLSSLLISH